MKRDKDFNNFLKQSINLKDIRDERKKEISKSNLYKSSKKKIQTTMIGALDVIEKSFGFLWCFDSDSELTEEQKHLKQIYEEARASILDKGNTQIRNLEAEFSNYEISRKRYQINLPMSHSENPHLGEKDDGKKQND
jgi:transcription termination factor Rho